MQKESVEISLQGFIDGDSQVVSRIYTKIFPRVCQFVLKNSGNEEDAYEVFQETLFQIMVRAKTKGLTIDSNFSGYIYICSRNIWFNTLNKSKKNVRNDTIIELTMQEDVTIEGILFQERWDLFESKMSLLTEKCKSLLKDYFQKVPYVDLLKKYGYTSKNVAFQRIHKCKKKLGDLIRSDQKYKDL